jgi:protein-tyrosine-phosphatase
MLPHDPESAFGLHRECPPYRSILFVCDANTCRSPMAEAMLRKMLTDLGGDEVAIKVASAGVSPNARDGSDMTFDARWLLKEEGIQVEDFRSRDLKRHSDLLKQADLVLTMSHQQKKRVHELAQYDGKPVFTLKEFVGETGDIGDPFGKDEAVYTHCRDEIKRCLRKLLLMLIPDRSL